MSWHAATQSATRVCNFKKYVAKPKEEIFI